MKRLLILTCLLVVVTPFVADARHRSYGVDRSKLDEDRVASIPIPVLFGVTYDEIYPDFGDPRDGGSRSHEGEDMLAPQGTPIVSPTEAIVISVGEGASAGNYVYTANPGGETFRYMHLDTVADIKRGDMLAVGDFIGTVGDTGNAAPGAYHLHFEMRDDDNDPQDPYPRLTDSFTLKEKISFLEDILSKFDGDEEEYAAFLVATFDTEFKQALEAEYEMPEEIEEALEDAGVVSTKSLQKQLDALIASIPKLLSSPLQQGAEGTRVTLLQLYLIYTLEPSVAKNELLAAGATGYYGPITASAVTQLQVVHGVAPTGIYDSATRAELLK